MVIFFGRMGIPDRKIQTNCESSVLEFFCPFTGPFLLKFWVFGAIAWVIIFSLIQSGLREIAAMSYDSDIKLKEDTT